MPPHFFYGGQKKKGLQNASVLSGSVLFKQPNNKSVQNWALCRTGPLLPTRPLPGLPSCGKGLTPGVSQAPRAALLPWQPSGIAARFLPHTEPQGGKKMIFPFSFWAGPLAKQPGVDVYTVKSRKQCLPSERQWWGLEAQPWPGSPGPGAEGGHGAALEEQELFWLHWLQKVSIRSEKRFVRLNRER